jgi:short-subunit dehydrogenase
MIEVQKGTALITGASSGIGEVYARRLAAEGYDLLLTARRAERLEALAAELEQQYGSAVDLFPADLADPDSLRRLEERVAGGPPLALLVNNAGFGVPGPVFEADSDLLQAMIDVHLTATVRLCRAALPAMIRTGGGAVINVSSVAAFLPTPRGAVYSATKAFLNLFTEALGAEVAGTAVRVQALCPGFTRTGFHDTPEYGRFDRSSVPRWLWMSAGQVVDISLAALRRRRVVVIAGWRNRLLVALLRTPLLKTLLRRLARKRKEQQ